MLVTAVGVAAQAAPRPLLPGPGQFYPVSIQVPNQLTIAAGATASVQVAGVGGIPSAPNVATAALNLTVRGSGGAGGLIAFPSGQAAPATVAASYHSNVDETAMVMVRTGSDGKVALRNTGAVTAVVSVHIYGWVSAVAQATAGTALRPLAPARIVNWASVPAGGTYTFAVLGQGGVTSTGVAQVAFTLEAFAGTAGGALTVYPSGTTRPGNPQLRYTPGVVAQNLVLTKVGADGKVTVHNSGAVEAVIWADVAGYMVDTSAPPGGWPAGSLAVQLNPARIVASASVPAGGVYTLSPLNLGGVPPAGVSAVGITLTARSAAAGTLRPYPQGQIETHTLGFTPNLDATAFTVARLGSDGTVRWQNTGTAAVTLKVDVYLYYRPAGGPSAPSNVQAYPTNGGALVTWTPPASDGGANIGTYYVTAYPGFRTVTVDGDTNAAGFTGLTNGQEYVFVVWAVNRPGEAVASPPSAPSNPVVPQVSSPPGAPLVVDTYARDRAVRVAWSPAAAGDTAAVTRYVVAASPGGSTVEAAANATEATVGGLANGTRYTFTVTAVNSLGSAVSPPSRPTTPVPARKPVAPPVTQVIALNQRIDVQWAAPPDGGSPITGYTVTAAPGGPTLSIPAGTTLASLTGLTNGTAYTVSVTADNVAGASNPTIRAGVRPAAARTPAPPTGVRSAVSANGTVKVSWAPPADVGTSPISGYGIQAIPGPVATIALAGATEATLTGLNPAIEYGFAVIAVNSAGNSAPSVATAPIRPKLTVKAAPVVLSAAAVNTLRAVRTDGTLEFEAPPAEVTNLARGSVVVLTPSAKAPHGFFGAVTTVTSWMGMVVVSTDDASLTDVLAEGAFAVETPVGSNSVASFEALSPGVRLSRPTVGGGRQAVDAGASIRFDDSALVINLEHDFELEDGVSGGKIEASLIAKPILDITAKLTTGGVVTDSDIGMDVTATAKGTIGPMATWSTELPLAKVKGKCFTVNVGPLPVTLCPEFTAKIKVTFSAGAGFDLDVDYGRKAIVHVHTNNATVDPPTFTYEPTGDGLRILQPYGTFGAKIGMPIEGTLYLYDVAGPGGKIEPFVEGKLDTRATEKCWTVEAGIKADVWLRAHDLFGDNLDWTREGVIDDKDTVAEADGPCRGIRVTPELAKTPVGQPVQFTVESLGGAPTSPLTWSVIQGPGTVDANGRYVSTTDAYAVVEAVRPQGGGLPEYRSRAGVVTGTPPPGRPVIGRLRPGPFSADVSWTPPAAIPGQTITQYAVITMPPTRTTFVAADRPTSAHITGLKAGEYYEVAVYAIAGNLAGAPSEWAGPVKARDALARPGSSVNMALEGDLTTGLHGSAVSGDGRYVFFVTTNGSPEAPPEIYREDGRDLYVLRKDVKNGEVVLASRGLDGTSPLEVFDGGGPGELQNSVAPSRDGTRVAFVGEQNSPRTLYVHDIVNRRTTKIPGSDTGSLHGFAVSDDASVVTFKGVGLMGTTGTHLFRSVNGATPQRIDNCLLGTDCDTSRILEMVHSMSGDGTKIVYEEIFGVAPDTDSHVLLHDVTTGATRDLTPNLADLESYHYPVISPDGTKWAAAVIDSLGFGIVVKDINAGRPGPADRIVSSLTGPQGIPAAFSRNGSTLAFRWNPGLAQPYGYVYSAGGGVQRLPDTPLDVVTGTTVRYWIEWGLDMSDDGTIITFQRALCNGAFCELKPGFHNSVR